MADKRFTRGIQSHKELDPAVGDRDISTPWEVFRHHALQSDGLVIAAVILLGAMFMMPSMIEIFGLIGLWFYWWADHHEFRLPFRLPASSEIPDPSTPKPKPSKIEKKGESKNLQAAAGIAFLGNDRRTGEELWLSDDDMRTHMLVVGSTGAGKALRDEEWVHTPKGWKRMDSLAVGDLVSTPDGKSTAINGVFPQGELQLWRVTFDDDRFLDVTAEHLWSVGGYHQPNALDQGTPLSVENLEIIDTLTLQRRLELHEWDDQYTGLAIPMTLAPDTDPQVGTESNSSHSGAQGWTAPLVAAWKTGRYDLEMEKLLQNASRLQRRQLWAAVLDGFNTLHMGSATSIELNEETEVKPLIELAYSLGWWAKEEKIQGSHNLIVRHSEPGLKIKWVERLETKADCRCIKIANENGLFVVHNWLVTHNTESLLSMAYNALVQGSGFIYVDGKGDSGLWAKIFSICRTLGREDDLLVINYMKGGRDVFGPQRTRLSNTINPFVSGSSGGLTELVVGLMDESGGDNAMWKGRAISLISAIMMALCWMRDNTGLLLDVEVIRDYLLLENIQKLSKRRDLPPNVIQSVRAYLRSLPGYVELAPKQSETVLDQHGYLQMQFTKIMGSLADTYGYIFKTNLGEVDFFDVVIQRRILVVLLPALENSPDELSNLGKIIVANLKQMMASTLGDILEGDYKDIIESKPTTAPSPYMVILDEYGYYVVKGAAVMPAQARSLGFCMIFAGQDYPSFKKNNNAEEAAATIGNCNVKIFMKVEDPTDTYDLAQKTGGEALVSKTSGFQRNTGGIFNRYMDTQNANIERRNRVDLRDLQSQKQGEAHIFFQSTLVRAQMFYAQPPKAPQMQINHFLRVAPPERQEMKDFDLSMEELRDNLMDEEMMNDYLETTDRIPRIEAARCTFDWLSAQGKTGMDAALGAIVAVQRSAGMQMDSMMEDAGDMVDDDDDENGHDSVNLFGRSGSGKDGLFDLNEDSDDEFEEDDDDDDEVSGGMFLDEKKTFDQLRQMEEAAGRAPEVAAQEASQMMQDMKQVSNYPDSVPEDKNAEEIMGIIEELGVDESDD